MAGQFTNLMQPWSNKHTAGQASNVIKPLVSYTGLDISQTSHSSGVNRI